MNASTPALEKEQEKLDSMASRYVDVAELPWVETKYPGVKLKVLLENKETGLFTALFHWEPGAKLPLHEHVGIEQTYVLEGSLKDHDGECTVGNFVWRPPGSRHEAVAPNGALLLAMLETPNKFLKDL
jgi:anti-sigma factor ChrR (cupin superfamily)